MVVNPYFSPDLLAIMAKVSEAVSTASAYIYEPPIYEDDGMGGRSISIEGLEMVYENVPVRIGPLREQSEESLVADSLQETALVVLVTQLDVAVLNNYIVVINGRPYEVKGIVPVPTAAFERHYLVKPLGPSPL